MGTDWRVRQYNEETISCAGLADLLPGTLLFSTTTITMKLKLKQKRQCLTYISLPDGRWAGN